MSSYVPVVFKQSMASVVKLSLVPFTCLSYSPTSFANGCGELEKISIDDLQQRTILVSDDAEVLVGSI